MLIHKLTKPAVLLILAAAVAGYAGPKLFQRLAAGNQLQAAVVTGQPFVIHMKESITWPDGTVHPAVKVMEARAADGTRYSFNDNLENGLDELKIVRPTGLIITAVPRLKIKTTTRLPPAEFAASLEVKADPSRNCAASFSGQQFPGNYTAGHKLGAHNAAKLISGAAAPGKMWNEVWFSTDFACVQLASHNEYRTSSGVYSESNQVLVSLERTAPEDLSKLAEGFEEVPPSVRFQRTHDFAGVRMDERLKQMLKTADERYKLRQGQ